MISAQTESIGGNQNVYLNRHFPNRLALVELRKLPKPRVKAFFKKYRHMEFKFTNDSYKYNKSDLEYNSYFGTDIEHQMKEYFSAVKALL